MNAKAKRIFVVLFSVVALSIVLRAAFNIGNVKVKLAPFSDMATILESIVVIITILGLLYLKFSFERMQIAFILPSTLFKLKNRKIRPLYEYFNASFLVIREGAEIRLENKLIGIETRDNIAFLKNRYNTRLGFEFKCHFKLREDLNLNHEEREKLSDELKQNMNYLGYQEVGRFSLDNKMWFLMPDSMQIGVLNASERERIKNNFYYPTLPNRIYPHLIFHFRIPLSYDNIKFTDEIRFYLTIKDKTGAHILTKDLVIKEENEQLNFVTLFADINHAVWGRENDLRLNFYAEIKNQNLKADIIDAFETISKNDYLNSEIDSVANRLYEAIEQQRHNQWEPSLVNRLSNVRKQMHIDQQLSNTIVLLEDSEKNTIEHLTERLENLQKISKQEYDIKLRERDGRIDCLLDNVAAKVYSNMIAYDDVFDSYLIKTSICENSGNFLKRIWSKITFS